MSSANFQKVSWMPSKCLAGSSAAILRAVKYLKHSSLKAEATAVLPLQNLSLQCLEESCHKSEIMNHESENRNQKSEMLRINTYPENPVSVKSNTRIEEIAERLSAEMLKRFRKIYFEFEH